MKILLLCSLFFIGCNHPIKPIKIETNEDDCTIHCFDDQKCIYKKSYYTDFVRKEQMCIPYVKPTEYCSENEDCIGETTCKIGICIENKNFLTHE